MDKQIIIVGFLRPKKNNIISRIISFVEGVPFSHTYIRIYADKIDRWIVYHASRTNLHFSNWDKLQQKNIIVEEYAVIVTEEQKNKILQYCIDTVENPYGTLQLIGMGIARLQKVITGKGKNPFRDGERSQVCSELVGRILRIIGVDIQEEYLEIEGPKFVRDLVKKIGILINE